jgi:DNA-binding transcriptional ArsR family regulator
MESGSQDPPRTSEGSSLPEARDDRKARSAPYVPPRMVQAMSVPARVRILAVLNERSMGASQYAEEFNLEVTAICRHFAKLEKLGYLEEVDVLSGRRGRPERIFRATQVVLFDTKMWERLPEAIRCDYSGVIWETYGKRVNEAMEAGTFDADVKRHFSWKPIKVDQQGWEEFVTGLDAYLDRVMEIEVESAERMAESGEEPISATVGLGGFRSPKSAQDGPPVR